MPYPRYNQGSYGGGNSGGIGGGSSGSYRKNEPGYSTGSRRSGYESNSRGMVSPWQGGPPGGLLPTPGNSGEGNNLALALGSLLGNSSGGSSNTLANLAGQLAVAQAAMSGGSGSGGGGSFGSSSMSGSSRYGSHASGRGNVRRSDSRDSRFRRDRSPIRRGYRRSRSRSPPRRSGRSHDDRGNRGRKRTRDSSPMKQRPEHEIYIGNYPVKFREGELRKLFEEHGVKVKAIRMKHDGLKVFAFAETENKAEIEKAVSALDSKEINGRRLRVRSAGDKEPKNANDLRSASKRELTVSDVTRHLVFAFNEFLDREITADGASEDKVSKLKQAKDLIKEAYNLPDDDSLKISRHLELIFMQNNRREIKPPVPEFPKDKGEKSEEKESQSKTENSEQKVDEDDGNWKRRKTSKNDDEEEEEEKDQEENHHSEEELIEEINDDNEVHENNENEEEENVNDEEEIDNEEEQDEQNENDEQVEQEEQDVNKEELEQEESILNENNETEEAPEKEPVQEPEKPVEASPKGTRGRGRGRGGSRARRSRGKRA